MNKEAAASNLKAAFLEARDADAPLNDRLEMYTRVLEQNLPSYSQCVEKLIGRLRSVGTGSGAPQVGEHLPEFLLPDTKGHLVRLSGILCDGPAAIVLMRGHWCPYCRLTADALARLNLQLRPGRRIIALTPERQTYTQKLLAETSAGFSILTDSENGYALSLNLAVWLGDELCAILTDLGRDLALYQGNDGWVVPVPATFVVSSSGIILARFVNPDYRLRMDCETLASALNSAS